MHAWFCFSAIEAAENCYDTQILIFSNQISGFFNLWEFHILIF